jgi:hypothetical protein
MRAPGVGIVKRRLTVEYPAGFAFFADHAPFVFARINQHAKRERQVRSLSERAASIPVRASSGRNDS